MKKVGQQLVEELQYTLGPKLKKHKELFISCVEYIFEKWMGGQYKNDFSVVYAVEKLFYKKLLLRKGMKYGQLLQLEKCLCRVHMKISHPE